MNSPAMTDILDIQGILHSPLIKILKIGFLVFLILVSLLVLLVLIQRVRRRRALGDDHLSPSQKAFLEIERLKQQKFLERGDFRRYYFFLSEIFRRYLFERFAYPALEKTTLEILSDLPAFPSFQQSFLPQVDELLKTTDQVKFAGEMTTANAAHGVTEKIISFVNQTNE